MSQIIVKSMYRYDQFRFTSLDDFIHYSIQLGKSYGIKDDLRSVVEYNVCYRNFLRGNGYPALVERLKADSPYLAQNPQEFIELDEWWRKLEENGGLGDYDIQCYGKEDSFTLFGETVNGLKGLFNIVQVSELNKLFPYLRTDIEHSQKHTAGTFVDKRKNQNSSLFAAEIYERYPIFDSYDAATERRFYECFYVKNQKISDDFFDEFTRKDMTSMVNEHMESKDLPLVYYDGESHVLFVVTPR